MIPTASPRYLLDSGIIIRYLRADPRAPALLDQLAQLGEVSTSAVTVFEIFRGCRSSQEEAAASELFTLVPAVALDRPAAETGGRISRDHAGIFSSERAAPDALIAGTALNGAGRSRHSEHAAVQPAANRGAGGAGHRSDGV